MVEAAITQRGLSRFDRLPYWGIGLLCLVAAATGIRLLSLVAEPEHAARLRNSLLFSVINASEVEWPPDQTPPDYLLEKSRPPGDLARLSGLLHSSEHEGPAMFGLAVQAGRQLVAAGRKGGAIQKDTLSAYKMIVTEGTGYCADYTQVLLGIGHAAGFHAREWGMSFDAFSGDGHAFSEVYEPSLSKWIFVDTFYSFYVTDRRSGSLLSALEFRDRLVLDDYQDTLSVHVIAPGEFGFLSPQMALDYYRQGVDQFYLWWGENVFQYDQNPWVRAGSRFGRSVEQTLGILAGVQPGIRIIRTTNNAALIARLEELRTEFYIMTGLLAVSVFGLFSWFSFFTYRMWVVRRHRR